MASPTFLLPLFLLVTLVQGDPDLLGVRTLDTFNEDIPPEDGEERFLFTSTSTVTVNSTLLRAIGAIVGALLLALPLYLAYATAANGTGGGNYYRRFRREDEEDLASHMYVLTEAYRKYNIEHIGCQILLACEAGQTRGKKDAKHGKLTATVHKVLTTAVKAFPHLEGATSDGAFYVKEMLRAHAHGLKPQADCQREYEAICPTLPEINN